MEQKFEADERELDELFREYRLACPEVEPCAQFMPALWQRIESRRDVWFYFGRLGRNALAISGALCLVLLAMNLSAPPQVAANYADALLSDDSTQQVYFSELTPPTSSEKEIANQSR